MTSMTTPPKEQTPDTLRTHFEALASDPSFKLSRSRRGTYVNPAVARDWKWFQLGASQDQQPGPAGATPYPMVGDEDESELGDWQDGATKPTIEGTYLREFDEGPATSEFYEGKWLRDGFFPSDIQDARWRGRNEPAPAPKPAPAGATFQKRVQPWLLECFGAEIAADTVERNHRFLEESLELVQSLGCTASEAHQLVDYVFGRTVGDPPQEVGGVMVTLAALCLASGLDMHDAGEVELARISAPELVAKIRAKQAAKPKHSPLPESAAPQADSQPAPATQQAGKSVAIQWLAEMIMSDCGCSTQNQRLLDRIIERITQYERANTSTQSEGGAQAPLIDTEAIAYNEWFNGEQGTAYYGMWEFARAAWMARAARAPADSVTAPAGGVGDAVDAIALARYKVVPAHESMFHRFAVVAGDGKQQLYLGREVECENMARKFAGAFLDGAFYQSNIEPTLLAQAADSALKDHQIAALVNELRDIAIQYHGTQQLRERIARAVVPALKAQAADSVTAPAATPSQASIAWSALRALTDPLGEAGVKIMGHVRIYAQRQYEAGLTEGRATPPAQAADSVLEDAARLDWLDQQCEAYGFQDIHEGNRWEISGAYANVREAIDAERAARKQGGKP